MKVGDPITVCVRLWNKKLYRAYVVARAWPGSRFNWFEYQLSFEYRVEGKAGTRYKLDMRDVDVTWAIGHDTPEARALATALALEVEE